MLKSKNKLLLIIFLFYTLFSYSQNLPNYDFEEWEQYNSFNNPINWGTSNFSVYSVYNFNPVTQEEINTYSGSSCIKLETIEKNVAGETVKVAGVITLGTFDINLSTRTAVIKGGIPFINRPSVFSGFYKYSTLDTDSCIMGIYLTKYDISTEKRDTLGIGKFVSSNQADWSLFEAPINYNSNEDPDSMNIIIISSDTSIFDTGSTLFIDKLYIDASLSSNKQLSVSEINIVPNPASDYIKINNLGTTFCKYSIIDLLGNTRLSSNYHATGDLIDVSKLNPGLYYIKIITHNNVIISRSIIIK